MNLLTENIRWVQSLTLEGDLLSADDIVVRRAMVAGARIDRLGVRVSFVVAAGLFLGSLIFSVSAFMATLQFFQPDYTVFALSVLPVLIAGAVSWRLRPRRHFTLLLRDGSAIGVRSRDGNYLTRCLEAFERMWADPARSKSSLYLNALHRSVDFGPVQGGIDVVANAPPATPVPQVAPLPAYTAPRSEIERAEVVADMPPVRAADDQELEALIPRRNDEEEGTDEQVSEAPLVQVDADEEEEPPLPPLPPPLPTDEFPPVPEPVDPDDDLLVPMEEHEADADADADEAEPESEPGDEAASAEPEAPEAGPEPDRETQAEPDPEPKISLEELVDLPLPQKIDAIHFAEIRPKVEALVRLLRERAPSQGIGDAVDVLEMMTRRGCKNEREVRALARSAEVLRERMHAYPTAVELMDDVRRAGLLPPSPKPPTQTAP